MKLRIVLALSVSISGWAQVAPPRTYNTDRINHLITEGRLRLSLDDAIALALENNLDVELERYTRRLAATDLLRAQAGGSLRGIPLSVREGPSSVGVPVLNGTNLGGGDAPSLNRLEGAGAQIDLSLFGSLPLSTGPEVPNFDPSLSGTLTWNHQSDPQNSTFLGPLRSLNTKTAAGDIGIAQGFATGATVSLNFQNLHQSSNTPLLSYSPYSTSSLGLTFIQPLLRGAGQTVNKRYIHIARNNQRVSDLVFRQQVISTVYAVVRLYWDLVSLTEDVRVREEAVSSAEQLLKDTEESASTGVLAAVDVTRARAEIARRRRDLLVAQSLVRQQSEVLKDYVTRSEDSALRGVLIQPSETLHAPDTKIDEPLNSLVEQALRERPDLAQARIQLSNSEISLKGSRSALLPTVNVIASVTNNGLAGDPSAAGSGILPGSTANPYLTGGYGDALSQIFRRNFPDYSAGVQVNIPIRNRAARADVSRDELQVRQ
jgi:outer membrane protein